MPMAQRRHTVFILLGSSVSTLSAIQAFQHSVHAVVNREELGLLGPNILGPIVQRVVADNDLFSMSIATPNSAFCKAKSSPNRASGAAPSPLNLHTPPNS